MFHTDNYNAVYSKAHCRDCVLLVIDYTLQQSLNATGIMEVCYIIYIVLQSTDDVVGSYMPMPT